MSLLLVMPEADPARRLVATDDHATIARALGDRGVRFERWSADVDLAPRASQERVLAAYARDVERLCRDGGYQSSDVVRFAPDAASDPEAPEKIAAARAKFLEEHTHAEDEVRFFVEGAGAFYLRMEGLVHVVRCERGDLISVPAGTRHWFDMGSRPAFCAIRLFTRPDGWVATFTGDPIARAFPSGDDVESLSARGPSAGASV